eukprot:NODE_1932_length_694_cov_55.262787_g1882_i0.p1 GENE.NODE_1932_length_694_cov_55.262787_g1882_i0~~NODE_1932_length_694_cov_55.262787_g1882_i0.p1  ORF type:complete len:160 (+),score=3.79 NODE_1932_length_694_cov_55.262787_g1882_i0:137-616(+)
MDRAMPSQFISQQSRGTLENVQTYEQLEDKQLALHEPWTRFCDRAPGCREDIRGENREKWVTETWEEYEDRIPIRQQKIRQFNRQQDQISHQERIAREKREASGQEVIDAIMERERVARAQRLQPLHSLLPAASDFSISMSELSPRDLGSGVFTNSPGS